MKTPSNRIAIRAPNTSGVEGYVFDGVDGTQIAFWECGIDATTDERVRDFDEYLLVVEGQYTLLVDGEEIHLGPGEEYRIPRGARIGGRVKAGTRTIHMFGETRAQRGPAAEPLAEAKVSGG